MRAQRAAVAVGAAARSSRARRGDLGVMEEAGLGYQSARRAWHSVRVEVRVL